MITKRKSRKSPFSINYWKHGKLVFCFVSCTSTKLRHFGIVEFIPKAFSINSPFPKRALPNLSCTTGFTNIASATNATYDATPGQATYYRLITNTLGGCTSGNCADTSACISVQLTDVPNASVADVLKCTTNSEMITVSPSGGIPPYTYQWSGPFIGTPPTSQNFTTSIPGTYTVTVTDDEGCTQTASGEMTFQSKVCLPATFTIRRGGNE